MSGVALALYLAGLAVTFGLRTWLQVRRTGDTGFRGISGRPGSLRWCAGVLFVVAVVLGVLGPALAVADVLPPPSARSTVPVAGLGLVLVGFLGVLSAQTGMGTSWRIGVQDGERTELVTEGLFAHVRNPIFSFMVVAQVGFMLLVPTWVSSAALLCLVVAVELQVRFIEEPYLLRMHGGAYRTYAARAGRFVPRLGRLRPG